MHLTVTPSGCGEPVYPVQRVPGRTGLTPPHRGTTSPGAFFRISTSPAAAGSPAAGGLVLGLPGDGRSAGPAPWPAFPLADPDRHPGRPADDQRAPRPAPARQPAPGPGGRAAHRTRPGHARRRPVRDPARPDPT